MGLLDDAIREHLELKRRHGADASEIDRLEHEALGPVRRQPLDPAKQVSVAPAEPDDTSVASDPPSELSDQEDEDFYEEEYYDEPEADDWAEEFDDDLERPDAWAPEGEPPRSTSDRRTADKPPPPDDGAERRLRRWRRSQRSNVPPEDASYTQADPPVRGSGRDDTVEYGVEDALAARGGTPQEGLAADQPATEEEADVLEETPEFLQDAPEHDRLWFEQRPPRDFDFDD